MIVIVVGATALSGGWLDQPTVAPTGSPCREREPDVAIVTVRQPRPRWSWPPATSAGSGPLDDGAYAYNLAASTRSARSGDQPGCAALDEQAPERLDLGRRPAVRSSVRRPTTRPSSSGRTGPAAEQVFVVVAAASPARESQPSARDARASETPTPTETAAATPAETASTTPSARAGRHGVAGQPRRRPRPPPDRRRPEPRRPSRRPPEPSPIVTPMPTPSTLETPVRKRRSTGSRSRPA